MSHVFDLKLLCRALLFSDASFVFVSLHSLLLCCHSESAQVKMGGKANKLTLPGLKKLCEIFLVDLAGIHTKEKVVDALLDFLENPSEKNVGKLPAKKKAVARSKTKKGDKKDKKKKGSGSRPAKKKPPAGKRKKATAVRADVEEEPVDGEIPTDAQLETWCKAYVRCFPAETTTIKHAMATAKAKFGADMKDRKDFIKIALTAASDESPKKKKRKTAKKPAAAKEDDDDDDDEKDSAAEDKDEEEEEEEDEEEEGENPASEAAADDEKEIAPAAEEEKKEATTGDDDKKETTEDSKPAADKEE